MGRPIFHCQVCGAAVHQSEDTCVACGAPVEGARHSGENTMPNRRPGISIFPRWFPTGLIITLGLWCAGVYGYGRYEDLRSPEYESRLLITQAELLMGTDDGRSAPEESLRSAFGLYVKALEKFPGDRWIHQRAESIKWRYAERGLTFPADLDRTLRFISEAQKRAEKERRPVLVSGVRDRWDIDALKALPKRFLQWGAGGAVLITLVYGWWRIQKREPLEKGPPTREELDAPRSRRH